MLAARGRQHDRAQRLAVARSNARLSPAELERAAPLGDPVLSMLGDAMGRLGLSARGYHRVWRLARTLADLEGIEAVGKESVAEALTLRALAHAVVAPAVTDRRSSPTGSCS